MEGEGKMIRWTRPEGGQGQVRKRVCAWRTWFRVRSTPGPCPASPSFSLPTQGSLNSKSSESEKREAWRSHALGCPRGPHPATPDPAAPNTHSLNELQPLLDVRLPPLPLHQSLRRERHPSGSQRGRSPSTPTSLPSAPSLPAHPISQGVGVSLRAVTHLGAHTDLQHTALPPHLHPHWTLSLDSTFNGQGGS